MERTNVAFLLVVALSTVLGASVAAGFGSDLRAIDAVSVVQDRISTEITDAAIEDQRLQVTVRVHNPTRYDFRLSGSHFRVYNDTEPKLAYASGERVDDGDDLLGARNSLVLSYQIRLTPTQDRALQAALRKGDANLRGTHSLWLGDTQFSVAVGPVAVPNPEGGS